MYDELITDELMQHFVKHCAVSVGLWVLVVLAIFTDLWDGVYTAKMTQQRIHSRKFRVTIGKVSEYWRLMLIGFFIDTLGILFPFYTLPYISIVFCIGLIGVEAKSMLEHAKRRRSKAVEAKDIILHIVSAATEKDALEIFKKINDFLNDNKKQ